MKKDICWWCGYCSWLGADHYKCLLKNIEIDAQTPHCERFTFRFYQKKRY